MPSWLRGPGREAMMGGGEYSGCWTQRRRGKGRRGEGGGGRKSDGRCGRQGQPKASPGLRTRRTPCVTLPGPAPALSAYFRTSFCPDRAMAVEPLGMPAGVAPRRDRQLIEPRVLRAVDVISPRIYASEALQSAPSLFSPLLHSLGELNDALRRALRCYVTA